MTHEELDLKIVLNPKLKGSSFWNENSQCGCSQGASGGHWTQQTAAAPLHTPKIIPSHCKSFPVIGCPNSHAFLENVQNLFKAKQNWKITEFWFTNMHTQFQLDLGIRCTDYLHEINVPSQCPMSLSLSDIHIDGHFHFKEQGDLFSVQEIRISYLFP